MTDQHKTSEQELDDARRSLERVAENFGDSKNYTWCWDETRMHLIVSNATGDAVATLHLERVQ